MIKKISSLIELFENNNAYLLLAFFVVYLACVAAFIAFFAYTGFDDSFITYYVADQIAHHHGIINYSGKHIEQSSTLLWSSLIAFFVWLTGLRAAFLGPIMSFASWQLLTLCISIYAYKRRLPFYIVLSSVLLAPVGWWALSGMEVVFYVLCLTLYAMSVEYYAYRRSGYSVIALLLCSIAVTLIRPEGLLVILCADIGVILLSLKNGLRTSIEIFSITLFSVIISVLFRFYLGLRVFPNPVYMKESMDFHSRIERGYNYLDASFHDFKILSLVSFVLFLCCLYFVICRIWNNKPISWFVSICSCLILAIGAFSILAGGDWMWYGRFFVPVFFLSSFAGLSVVTRPYRLLVMILLLFATGFEAKNMAESPVGGIPVGYANIDNVDNYNPVRWDAYSRIHARDIRFIDKFIGSLRSDSRTSLTIASIQAGMVMYYVDEALKKKINFIDLVGLSSKSVQSCYDWGVDPYKHWKKHERCIERKIDGNINYVFDLDDKNWTRMRVLEQQGCKPLVKETTILDEPTWKKSITWRQFAVKCH